jgi:hypothetical protein
MCVERKGNSDYLERLLPCANRRCRRVAFGHCVPLPFSDLTGLAFLLFCYYTSRRSLEVALAIPDPVEPLAANDCPDHQPYTQRSRRTTLCASGVRCKDAVTFDGVVSSNKKILIRYCLRESGTYPSRDEQFRATAAYKCANSRGCIYTCTEL